MHLELATVREAVGGSRYRVLGRLGSGGMADVDLALQNGVAGSSRLCVLKRVRKDLAERPEFVSMFFEEARISASLNHPNIVHVYEVGGDESDCFLAMEFLRGRSYAHVQPTADADREDYRVALEVLIGALAGLEHAHQRRDLSGQPMQLVHRDVSPPNLFVTYDGEIKVLDFGVAKSKRSLVHTQAGVLKGKVAYMAPELVAGEEVDARADLYAIGVMLWEATAGRDRWPNMNEMAILSAVAGQARPELPGAVSRGLPPLADEICARALARRPEARYQSAAELRSDLVRLCEALGGRPTQQELQGYMAQRFTRQREREEREIERALHAQRPSLEVGPSEQDGFAGTKRVARPAAKAISEPDVSRTEPWNESPEAQPASPRTSRAGVVALGVVVLGAGALAALALGTRSDRQTGSALPEAMPTSAAVAAIRAESAAPAASSPSAAPSASHGAQLPRSTGGAPSTSAAPPSSPRKGSPAIAKTKPKGSTPPTSKQLELDRQNPWQ